MTESVSEQQLANSERIIDAVSRLNSWLAVHRSKKQQAFVEDLEVVMVAAWRCAEIASESQLERITILDDPSDDRHDIVDRLMAERDRLRAILLGEEVQVPRFSYTREDGIEVEVEHWAVRHIVASLKETLFAGREAEDVSYLTMTVSDRDIGPIEVTLRKVWGGKRTPADTISEQQARIAALEDALRPFAEYAKRFALDWPDSTGTSCLFLQPDGTMQHNPNLTLGHCRKAKEVLGE